MIWLWRQTVYINKNELSIEKLIRKLFLNTHEWIEYWDNPRNVVSEYILQDWIEYCLLLNTQNWIEYWEIPQKGYLI